jgi:hypothetical protein
VYPLPFWLHGQNFYQKALGGWQLSGVTTIQSGLPFNVTILSDAAGVGTSSYQRPNILGPVYQSTNKLQYLNAAAFGVPSAGTFGNMGAFALTYPWFINWDASLQKAFPIGERVTANFRAELYDFPNHLSYTTVSTTVGSSNFGQVTAATDPRTLQLALRLSF